MNHRQIGNVNVENTLFNVGLGFTDETASYNHIQISDTPGTVSGLTNNPGSSSGTTYYRFTVLAPGCGSPGDGAVSIKTSYDTDGHLTGSSIVDVELSVNIWDGTHYDTQTDQSEFGVCIQADIMVIDGGNNPQVLESKQFDFRVTPIFSTFSVSPVDMGTNAITKVDTSGLVSGTTVTPHWASSIPLAPGEAVWFYLTIDMAPYVFTSFQEVQMTIGSEEPVSLVTGGSIVDTTLTSFELAGDGATMHFYHVLLRNRFSSEQQQIAFSGRANVLYSSGRRLVRSTSTDSFSVSENDSPNTAGAASADESKEAGFQILARMKAYDEEEAGSGGVKLDLLSMVIGGAGLAGAAVFL